MKVPDAKEIMQEHILKNNIVWKLWRGKMGLTKEEMEAATETTNC